MKKRKKTIGIYVMITLMLVAGIPIIVMLTSSYLTTKNLLIERNDLNKESAVNLILAEEKSLRRSTESKLKSMAELPAMKTEFSMGRIRSDLSLAIAGSNSFLAVTFGTEDDEYVTFNPLPDDYKPTIRPWYKGAVKAEGEVYWTAPYLDTVSNQFVTVRSQEQHLAGVRELLETKKQTISGFRYLLMADDSLAEHDFCIESENALVVFELRKEIARFLSQFLESSVKE